MYNQYHMQKNLNDVVSENYWIGTFCKCKRWLAYETEECICGINKKIKNLITDVQSQNISPTQPHDNSFPQSHNNHFSQLQYYQIYQYPQQMYQYHPQQTHQYCHSQQIQQPYYQIGYMVPVYYINMQNASINNAQYVF